MKFSTLSLTAAALAAQRVTGHATFQALWVGNTDYKATCVRLPNSNSPIENVQSTNIRCNANQGAVSGKCPVAAGSIVTVEMHQQPGDRSCASEAIGGQHYGPVIVYLSKVADASTADGSSGWFKIFQDGWAKLPGSTRGDDDYWGVKDLNKCCGRMNVKIPADIPSGDYLMRAEVIALHAATTSGGAQFYMSCYQLTVSGGGSANPATVNFPGAYSASDPGIGTSIHGNLNQYIVPGPAVYSGGSSKVAGASACVGVETGTTTGAGPSTTQVVTTTLRTTTTTAGGGQQTTTRSTTRASTTTAGGSTGGSPLYGQCGGNGWTGPTTCAQGRCVVTNEWYSQCVP